MEGQQDTTHPISLYWTIASQPSRSVKALLLAGAVPHNSVSIDLIKQEHKGEAYLQVNPRGLLPAIKDGDFILSESNAILKYLANTNESIPAHYWPKNDQQRAITDQFLEYYQNHFRPSLITPLRMKMMKTLAKVEYEAAAYEAALAQLWKEVDTLEVYLGQHEGAFVVNDQPTIADLQLFFEFQNLIYVGLDKSWETEKYPQVTAWYNKVIALPEVKGIHDQWIQLVAGFIKMLNA
ncbi:hypothetical protein FGO68_gene9662 [Halteria grandinella]|uniref:Glutathione S-transferase n=1 Tax=Halteria grandinella TaxID=5974 RepID=A0A8J8SYU8_HALGN|nr:hypothetical protein FGO68_gene9662 [Halteria grandinella]